MNEALLIVDMQTGFATAQDEDTIRGCMEAIKVARKDDLPIFVLEFENNGNTLRKLQDCMGSHEAVYYVMKDQDDGGYAVMEHIEARAIKEFRVCGVNIDACVKRTVHTLVNDYDKQIRIIKDACNGNVYNGGKSFEGDEKTIYKHKNVVLV